MNNVYTLSNPPSAPLKKKAEARFQPPLEWRDRARRNLAHEFSDMERKACLREAEEEIEERRRQREAEEKEERFLWLKEDFVEKELEGPFYFPDGTKFYL